MTWPHFTFQAINLTPYLVGSGLTISHIIARLIDLEELKPAALLGRISTLFKLLKGARTMSTFNYLDAAGYLAKAVKYALDGEAAYNAMKNADEAGFVAALQPDLGAALSAAGLSPDRVAFWDSPRVLNAVFETEQAAVKVWNELHAAAPVEPAPATEPPVEPAPEAEPAAAE